MQSVATVPNVPQDFDRFIAAPPHRLFAAFEDLAAGQEAIRRLRAEDGLSEEDDIWVFFGEEGRRRLDLSGAWHGVHAEIIRFMQRVMSADVEYLGVLDTALREGRMVLAVKVDERTLDRAAELIRKLGGTSMARVTHWDYIRVQS